jgi:hypothetical protein
VAAGGQCGLLDVLPDPDFKDNAHDLLVCFAEAGEGGNSTARGARRLAEDLTGY